jgi:hypothetical protein
MHKHEDMVLESLRALGTFSQAPDVRKLMQQSKGTEIVILLLDHSHREIVFTACGVLVNFAADAECKALFNREIVVKLTELMDDALEDDVSIATIVAKVLVNVAITAPNVFDNEISSTLRDLLEPELDPMEGEDSQELQEVATALLDIFKRMPVTKPKYTHAATSSSDLEPLH